MKWLARIREALRLPDPHNPVGGFQTPAYRIKNGVAHVVRSRPGVSEERRPAVEALLAPARYVSAGSEVGPKGGVRILSLLVEERWTAVTYPIQSEDPAEIMRLAGSGAKVAGWTVTQHARTPHCDCEHARFQSTREGLLHVQCGRPMRSRVVGEIRDHVLNLAVQTNDDATYSGYYPTIKGKDPYDDRVNTGGTAIKGGRAEYKRVLKQKNYDVWDTGWQKHTDRIAADKQSVRDAKFEMDQFRADKALPRKIGEV
ncbi:MAG: hypothetical protein NVSMB5_20090 [Candidatus Velthaea sp.]